jgi:carbon storage regulator CsrA
VLVLARKVNESILIGDNIVVKIISLENGIVKLGIDAPKEISIMRDELIEEVALSNKAASHKTDSSTLMQLSNLLRKFKK